MRFLNHWRMAVSALMLGLPVAAADAADVNVYTMREPGLIKPLFDAFSKQTGINVRAVFVLQGLPERLAAEGANSLADVMIVVDYGGLVDLVDKGVTQPIQSKILNDVIPASLRDPNGHWYALSSRARVIWVSKDRIKDEKLTYEDVASPRFKGRVCIRSGQHPYNTSLVAAMIQKNGAAAAEKWLADMKSNLARKATGGDRDVARDIMANICDVGIANSYYVGIMRSGSGGPDQKKWGDAIRVILPTFKDGKGTHANISGAAIAKHAPNKENAIKLLEYMVSDAAQKIYAEVDFEHPIKKGVPLEAHIKALGDLVVDPTPIADIVGYRKAASQLADKVGFDN